MKYLNYLSITLVGLFTSSVTQAQTYYVDTQKGNDSRNGTSSSVSANNGPWQSISKVNSTAFQPGDQVLFSCGQKWAEQLKPKSNGTISAPIRFGSYPAGCLEKPKISFIRSISNTNWQPYQGNIWKTTFTQSFVNNSSLSKSITNWRKWPSNASQTFDSGCPISAQSCMNFVADGNEKSSLIISDSFPVVSGNKYKVTLSFNAPNNTALNVIVRENGNQWESLGLYQRGVMGNNQWKDIVFEFTATRTLSNARLDIEVPKAKRIYLQNTSVQQSGIDNGTIQQSSPISKPNMVFFDNDPVAISHHPNAGHEPSKPESLYLSSSVASPTVTDSNGRPGSSKIIVSNLKLPPGVLIDPGTKMKLRDVNYELNNFSATAANATSVSFNPNTQVPLSHAGVGFYLYDALWMLDSPGEWYFDNTNQTLYLWSPTSENPGNRVSVATSSKAIDLVSRSNLQIDNLEIDGATTGIDLIYSENITLKNLYIHNIEDKAIYAASSKNPSILSNRINRVGIFGIQADASLNSIIEDNELDQIGIFLKAGKRISLPMTTHLAINGGFNATISNNLISDIGGFGIRSQSDSIIESNVAQRTCLYANDCGAIYINSHARISIKNNLVLDVPGDHDGVPKEHDKHLVGIYLDDYSKEASVVGNTVKGATYSIQMHNSNHDTISNNLFYGSERYLLWQQEQAYSKVALTNNKISDNQFFPTVKNVAITNTSEISNVSKFATYSNNNYSSIQSPYVVNEQEFGGLKDYSFLNWQTAKKADGTARNNDLDGKVPAPLTTFALGMVGNNFMRNGAFSDGIKGWGVWNEKAPFADKNLEGCLPVSANCVHVTGGAGTNLASSPSIAITKGKQYRVTFDLKGSAEDTLLNAKVRFSGPTKYDDLNAKSPYRFASSTTWKRHSFVFEAEATATNPDAPNQGARIDIQGLYNGQNLWIANLEIAQFDPGVFGASKSELLVNTSEVYKTIDCPTQSTNPSLCSNFVNFPEGTVAIWPISVPPRSGHIVFSQNLSLLDSDGDSIADSQDVCKQTVKGSIVNGKGCSLTD